MGEASRHQLRQDEARLNRLPEPDAVGKEQPDPARADGAEHRHELIRLDPEPARLRREQRVRPERLLEDERLVADEAVAQRRCAFGLNVTDERLDSLERCQQVEFLAAKAVFEAAKPVQGLRSQRLGKHHFPAQAAGVDFSSGQQIQREVSVLLPMAKCLSYHKTVLRVDSRSK